MTLFGSNPSSDHFICWLSLYKNPTSITMSRSWDIALMRILNSRTEGLMSKIMRVTSLCDEQEDATKDETIPDIRPWGDLDPVWMDSKMGLVHSMVTAMTLNKSYSP